MLTQPATWIGQWTISHVLRQQNSKCRILVIRSFPVCYQTQLDTCHGYWTLSQSSQSQFLRVLATYLPTRSAYTPCTPTWVDWEISVEQWLYLGGLRIQTCCTITEPNGLAYGMVTIFGTVQRLRIQTCGSINEIIWPAVAKPWILVRSREAFTECTAACPICICVPKARHNTLMHSDHMLITWQVTCMTTSFVLHEDAQS